MARRPAAKPFTSTKPAAKPAAASDQSRADESATDDQRADGPVDQADDGEEFEYELLEAGTIIDGKSYPDKEAEEGKEMIVSLTAKQAAEQQRGGVALRKVEEPA